MSPEMLRTKTFNGNTCRNNPEHGTLRYVTGKGCVACCRERGRKQPSSEYRVKDPDKTDGRSTRLPGYNHPTFSLHNSSVGRYWLGRPVWLFNLNIVDLK